ncbi:MAG: hypothetical protein ACK52L_13880 [Pirellula sp.]
MTRKIHSDDGRNLNGRVVGDLGVLWFLVLGSWTGDWRLETGEWRMENGDWRLENEKWRVTRDFGKPGLQHIGS